MRIEYAKSTGNPFGQFVVHAESELDRIILHNFLQGRNFGFKFWQHGSTHDDNSSGPVAFNFGWIKAHEATEEAE